MKNNLPQVQKLISLFAMFFISVIAFSQSSLNEKGFADMDLEFFDLGNFEVSDLVSKTTHIANRHSEKLYSELALTGRGDLKLVSEECKLQEEVQEAFDKMQKAALKEGISLRIVSEYRSFDRQASIWNRKYHKYISQGFSPREAITKIIEYSTLPGTSRHHWGTDIDLIDGSVAIPKSVLTHANYEGNGIYAKLKKWMDENSEKYGFYLVYTNDPHRKGFKYEPWHYSYKPLADKLLKEFSSISLVDLFKNVELKGIDYISEAFLEQYTEENILDINPILK